MKTPKLHLLLTLVLAPFFGVNSWVCGQELSCDPTKVQTAAACANCHGNEFKVWQKTPHFETFQALSRRPRSKEICKNMGLKSVKRSNVCIQCHFTLQQQGDRTRAVSGISCESCHGASKDWLTVHNDYGGPTATKESESPSQKQRRLEKCESLGMNNTRNLYAIASSCMGCHTVPNEDLVNVGGHRAGTADFELVAWSQGMVRHNFLRGNNQTNVESTPQKLRVMYVVGLIADLEFSTRATAEATSKSTFGLTVAKRAADKAIHLLELQKELQHPDLEQVLQAFANAELRINNTDELNSIADEIKKHGRRFAQNCDGSQLHSVDAHLPDPKNYKWQGSR